MESQGTYQADASADEQQTTPEKVAVLRPYTKVFNDYYEPLWSVAGPFRYFVLQYLIRQTWGFHRDAARLPLGTISTTLKLSRHVVINALRDLEAWHIIASDASDLGRTQVRTYRMLLPERWTLPTQTSASDALVEKKKQTSARHAPVKPQTSANNALDDSQTSASHAHIKRKPEKETPEERNDLLSDASHDAPRPDTSSSSEKPTANQKPEGKARKTFSPESDPYQLAVHLRDGILSHKPDARVPTKDAQLQQWAGVIDLMLRIDGRAPEQIRALIDAIMTNPRIVFWRGVILSPGNLRKHFDAIEIKWREHGVKSSTVVTPPPSSPDAEDALTRKGIETRERIARIRQQREAAEAAAKGAQS